MTSRNDFAAELPSEYHRSPGSAAPQGSSQLPGLSEGPEPLDHIAALDGLRAVAVLAVLAYHGEVPGFGGGFLGVSVFFTLSGFLVTRLLVHEWLADGRIDLRRFWSRRFRRLLPASWATLALVAAIGLVGLWTAGQLRSLGGDIVFAVGELFNWRLIAQEASYGSSASAPSPVQHFWSLAVEQQFYLLLPLVLLGIFALLSRRTPHRRTVLLPLVAVLGGLVVMSATGNLLLARGSVDRAYLGTDTRAAEMLLGAMLAVLSLRFRGSSRTSGTSMRERIAVAAAAASAAIGLGSLVVVAGVQDAWLYPWGLLATAVCTVVVLYACTRGGVVSVALSWRPLVAIGVISYGIYLVHWPVFLLVDERSTGLNGPVLFILRVTVTVLIAAASFVVLERPVRLGALVSSRRALGIVSSSAAVLAVAALAVSLAAPAEPSYLRASSDSAIEVIEPPATQQSPTTVSPPDEAPSSETVPSQDPVPSQLPAPDPGVVPAVPVSPAPPTVPDQTPVPPSRVLFVGDSIAKSIEETLGEVLVSFGVAFAGASAPGCGVITGYPTDESGRIAEMTRPCHAAIPARQLEAVQAAEPQLVVVMSSWEMTNRHFDGTWYPFGTAEADQLLMGLYSEAVQRLTAGGAKVALVLMPEVVDGAEQSAEPIEVERGRHLNELLEEVAAGDPRVVTLDLASRVCPLEPCPPTVDGITLRAADGRHFDDPAAARTVSEWLASMVLAVDMGKTPG